MKWPQIVMIGLIALELGYSLAKNGEPRADTYHFGATFCAWLLMVGILWWGGFWK